MIGFNFIVKGCKEKDDDGGNVLMEIWQEDKNNNNNWKKIESIKQEPNPMDKYFERRKTCKHDKGLTYGHCMTIFGKTEFDIVCDYCLERLYSTGGFLPVHKDPRLKKFVDIPEDEHKFAAFADLYVKIEKKLEDQKHE